LETWGKVAESRIRLMNADKQYKCKQYKKTVESMNELNILILIIYSHYSYRKRDIEHLLRLTDSFTWEELPTRDPDTGYLTKAGYIPIIQSLHKYFFGLGFVFQIIHSAVRIVSNHDFIVTAWFPFDTSAAPVYVFANITQVNSTVKMYKLNKVPLIQNLQNTEV
jgi:hypothetical protein